MEKIEEELRRRWSLGYIEGGRRLQERQHSKKKKGKNPTWRVLMIVLRGGAIWPINGPVKPSNGRNRRRDEID